jgi:glycosyltransferase involved in cell wall biosynthesis
VKTLHVDAGREMRGGQWQVLRLCAALRRRGETVRLLARGPLLDAASREGIPAEPLSVWALIARARECDLVHAHDSRSHTMATFAGGAPLVVSRRVAFGPRQSALSKWKYSRAAMFLAISEFVKQELIESGVSAHKIVVVPDGVELPDQTTDRTQGVVAIDTDDPLKGSDLIRAAGLEVEWSRDLEASLPHARVFVYATRAEGLGSAALLAMAHGVPVVASRVGGLPEVVEHEHNGLLVSNHPAEIRTAVERLLGDPDYAARLGTAGRRTVEQRFTTDRVAEATLEAYRQIRQSL